MLVVLLTVTLLLQLDVVRLHLEQHLLLLHQTPTQFLQQLQHQHLLKIMVLYLILISTKEKITDTYLIVSLKYVHTVHLKLLVQHQHSMLKILFLLVSVLVVELLLIYLVKVIRSGHHLTLDLDLQEFLEVLQMNRLHQLLILEKVLYSHSLVLLNLHLSVLFLVDYSNLVEMDIHYSVYNTLDLV